MDPSSIGSMILRLKWVGFFFSFFLFFFFFFFLFSLSFFLSFFFYEDTRENEAKTFYSLLLFFLFLLTGKLLK